jgi:itaconate CoA-transferase
MLKQKTILSLEQALTLPYATERFAQLGWRVIRIESEGESGQSNPGDPNRYIGVDLGEDDLHSYFIAPNLGKEAITLNLKTDEGQTNLLKIIKELDVDVFMCNTLPKRYEQLGIDYETLKEANPSLIWCGISALGPDYPDRAGYDPALQALLGYMYLTGEPERDPMLCGLPLIDLKAGDEAFAQVLLAMLEKEQTGKGKKIDISMAQCATSWLITAFPLETFSQVNNQPLIRSANEHRSFIPSNCYPSKDGYVYLAIGSDAQWQKLVSIDGFEFLDDPARTTNNQRKISKESVYADIRKALEGYTTSEFIEVCLMKGLAVAPVNNIKQVGELEFVRDLMVTTRLPDGREVPLSPAPMNTRFLKDQNNEMAMAPKLGEHNEKIFEEAGIPFKKTEK